MNDYDPTPYLSTQDKAVRQAWSEVLGRRSKQWGQTEAAHMFKALDLESRYFGVRVPLQRAFAHGKLDGSLAGLEVVAVGEDRITDFGTVRCQVLTKILFMWYKRGSGH